MVKPLDFDGQFRTSKFSSFSQIRWLCGERVKPDLVVICPWSAKPTCLLSMKSYWDEIDWVVLKVRRVVLVRPYTTRVSQRLKYPLSNIYAISSVTKRGLREFSLLVSFQRREEILENVQEDMLTIMILRRFPKTTLYINVVQKRETRCRLTRRSTSDEICWLRVQDGSFEGFFFKTFRGS